MYCVVVGPVIGFKHMCRYDKAQGNCRYQADGYDSPIGSDVPHAKAPQEIANGLWRPDQVRVTCAGGACISRVRLVWSIGYAYFLGHGIYPPNTCE